MIKYHTVCTHGISKLISQHASYHE